MHVTINAWLVKKFYRIFLFSSFDWRDLLAPNALLIKLVEEICRFFTVCMLWSVSWNISSSISTLTDILSICKKCYLRSIVADVFILANFKPMFPFYTTWKHRKPSGFFYVFRGYRHGTLGRNGLITNRCR